MENVLGNDIRVLVKVGKYFQYVMFCIPGDKIEGRSISNPAAILKS